MDLKKSIFAILRVILIIVRNIAAFQHMGFNILINLKFMKLILERSYCLNIWHYIVIVEFDFWVSSEFEMIILVNDSVDALNIILIFLYPSFRDSISIQ